MAPNDKPIESASNDNPTLPHGITQKYFEEILMSEFGHGVTIKKFIPISASGKGENYASEMYRIRIDFELSDKTEKTVSYIFKTNPSNPMGAEMIKKLNLFAKETNMYEIIIPKFEKLYSEHGKNVRFGPRCLKTTENPDTIVLEDLKVENFSNGIRQEGLNVEQTKCVLVRLAEFHAASACCYERDGHFPKLLMQGMYNEEMKKLFEAMAASTNKMFKDCMMDWEGFGPKYVGKIETIQNEMIDRLKDVDSIDYNDFNVLNHGDLWVNNIMFQTNPDGNVNKTYFVDFQMSKYGSPAQDLYYFLLSSTKLDMKIRNFDYFIKFYHDNLIENLRLLNYPNPYPKLADIHISLLKKGFYGPLTSLGVLTAVLLDPMETAAIENFIEANENSMKFKTAAFTNPRYIDTMREILPFLDNRGLLD